MALIPGILAAPGAHPAVAPLAGEADGFAFAFAFATEAERVLLRAAGADTFYAQDGVIQNAGTSPKRVHGATGALEWSRHNLFVNPTAPATQNVTLQVGARYTVKVTGSGSVVGSAGASGTASAGSPATFVATTTTGTFTVSGGPTTIQLNRGGVATNFLDGGGSQRFGLALDYDPVTLQSRGLLSEPASTNLFIRANELNNAAWTKTNYTVTGGNIDGRTAPDGSSDADKALAATGTNGVQITQGRSYTSGETYTYSLFVEPAGINWAELEFQTPAFPGTNPSRRAWFDVLNGAIGTVGANYAATGFNKEVGAWYRPWGVMVATGSGSSATRHKITNGNGNDQATGDGSVGMWHWGMQIEALYGPTSPITTYDVTVTRAADNYFVPVSSLGIFSATAGTVVIKATTPRGSVVTRVLWQIDDGTASNRFRIERDTSKQIRFIVTDGGVEQANINLGVVADNTGFTVAAAWSANDFAASLNGGAALTDSSGTLPAVTTFKFGYSSTAGQEWNRHIKTGAYIPRRLSNSEMVARQGRLI